MFGLIRLGAWRVVGRKLSHNLSSQSDGNVFSIHSWLGGLVGPLPPVFFPKFSAGLRIEIFGGDLVRTPHPQNLSLLANFSFLPPPPSMPLQSMQNWQSHQTISKPFGFQATLKYQKYPLWCFNVAGFFVRGGLLVSPVFCHDASTRRRW